MEERKIYLREMMKSILEAGFNDMSADEKDIFISKMIVEQTTGPIEE